MHRVVQPVLRTQGTLKAVLLAMGLAYGSISRMGFELDSASCIATPAPPRPRGCHASSEPPQNGSTAGALALAGMVDRHDTGAIAVLSPMVIPPPGTQRIEQWGDMCYAATSK